MLCESAGFIVRAHRLSGHIIEPRPPRRSRSVAARAPRAAELIRRLAELRCRFALDDFGTGSNSLTYLNTLPIARVRIDGSFVRDIQTTPRSKATVRGTVELARGMSVDTVAEYVEREAIAEQVRGLGVDYGQGYVFGRPEPLETVIEGLSREESQRLHRMFLEV